MKHLSPSEFVDYVDGALDPERTAHIAACGVCRREAEALRATVHEASIADAPEPSPLFWDHLRARVREEIAAPAPRIPWFRAHLAQLTAAAAALLVGAPVALAHEGSPNFLSQINEVTPAAPGVDVEVLNRDDRLLLRNNGEATVLIEGYEGEPYARIDPDGTVSVNTNSKAYYINEERDGEVAVPEGVDSKGEPQWKEVSKTGRFEWHDHRMHWMSKGDPEQVEDTSVRTKVFDWNVPVEVDGRPSDITGMLFWTPAPGGSVPWAPIAGLSLAAIAALGAVTVRRHRRRPAEAW